MLYSSSPCPSWPGCPASNPTQHTLPHHRVPGFTRPFTTPTVATCSPSSLHLPHTTLLPTTPTGWFLPSPLQRLNTCPPPFGSSSYRLLPFALVHNTTPHHPQPATLVPLPLPPGSIHWDIVRFFTTLWVLVGPLPRPIQFTYQVLLLCVFRLPSPDFCCSFACIYPTQTVYLRICLNTRAALPNTCCAKLPHSWQQVLGEHVILLPKRPSCACAPTSCMIHACHPTDTGRHLWPDIACCSYHSSYARTRSILIILYLPTT